MTTTLIRNASFVIAWVDGAHAYMPDADVAFTGGTISFVGRGYDGVADTIVDGAG